MSSDIPDEAVGCYLVVYPNRFWGSLFLFDNYETLARTALPEFREFTDDSKTILHQCFVTLVDAVRQSFEPEIARQMVHETAKQELYGQIHVAGSVAAFLLNERFFVLDVREDDDDDNGEPIIRFTPMPVREISEALALISDRPDVRAIERFRTRH